MQKFGPMRATLARLSMIDIGAFFAVLLVGFAYVWRRGDLDWVRAVSRERSTRRRTAASRRQHRAATGDFGVMKFSSASPRLRVNTKMFHREARRRGEEDEGDNDAWN